MQNGRRRSASTASAQWAGCVALSARLQSMQLILVQEIASNLALHPYEHPAGVLPAPLVSGSRIGA